jgi:hypothetical protein
MIPVKSEMNRPGPRGLAAVTRVRSTKHVVGAKKARPQAKDFKARVLAKR